MRIGASLCRVGILLADQSGQLGGDVTRLEDDGTVAEDEVYGSHHCAFSVVLAECVCVECVLEAVEGAAEEGDLVCAHSECYGLVT